WKGWAILLRQKQKKLIMLPSETMIWQPEFTDKTLSRKPGAVQILAKAILRRMTTELSTPMPDVRLMRSAT
ncbi:hypothetical protein, partial [Escherichia coli]|uniref:hypothetical protein n=1 Tax=Escherichia coli TaxID=562 RepID=UPI0011047F1D